MNAPKLPNLYYDITDYAYSQYCELVAVAETTVKVRCLGSAKVRTLPREYVRHI